MKYNKVQKARFLSRPNRFVALCELAGQEVVCHVKNTGRCRELLVPNCFVYLEESGNPQRKTKYDLVAVEKNGALFNIDAQAPNKVFGEWLEKGVLFDDISLIRPETCFKSSRFDFYVEHGVQSAFLEVKGVTLERDGVLLFPDAPTERGVKHIYELCEALAEGFEAYLVFVIQTERPLYFTPNTETHPAFAEALRFAAARGVKILCFSCKVAPDWLEIDRNVPIRLE